ncbi:hypothetical protein [uncultured Methanobrevibacter sp.]|nr:hypothetical protein [uncultured Methanobrevibacter sp.]
MGESLKECHEIHMVMIITCQISQQVPYISCRPYELPTFTQIHR